MALTRALLIGCNYPRTANALEGCCNDVKTMSGILQQNFMLRRDCLRILTDDGKNDGMPTYDNILTGFKWLLGGAQAGGNILMHYSGHGTQIADTTGANASRMADAIVPTDHNNCQRLITDVQMTEQLFDCVPANVRLTLIMDCCHSGTMINSLEFMDNGTQIVDGATGDDFDKKSSMRRSVRFAAEGSKGASPSRGLARVKNRHLPAPARRLSRAANGRTEANSLSGAYAAPHANPDAKVVLLSGCRDAQTSADAFIDNVHQGAFTWALTSCLKKNKYQIATGQLLEEAADLLQSSGYDQTPLLSSDERAEIDQNFLGSVVAPAAAAPSYGAPGSSSVVLPPAKPAAGPTVAQPAGGANSGNAAASAGPLSAVSRALFVGCNYVGQDCPLEGCWNDVKRMSDAMTTKFGMSPDDMLILTDDGKNDAMPTYDNILKAFTWLVDGAVPGRTLLFHYSGHGTQIEDASGKNASRMADAIVPCDHNNCTQLITDIQITETLFDRIPDNVRLTMVMDCCHSGTMVNSLEFMDNGTQVAENSKTDRFDSPSKRGLSTGSPRKRASGARTVAKRPLKVRNRHLPAPKRAIGAAAVARRNKLNSLSGPSAAAHANPLAKIVLLSGCRDNQTSADAFIDGVHQGAFTWSLLDSLEKSKYRVGHADLLERAAETLKQSGFDQTPLVSTDEEAELTTLYLSEVAVAPAAVAPQAPAPSMKPSAGAAGAKPSASGGTAGPGKPTPAPLPASAPVRPPAPAPAPARPPAAVVTPTRPPPAAAAPVVPSPARPPAKPAASASPAAASAPAASKGRKRAVLIGCSYPGQNVTLPGAVDDVARMRQILTRKLGFAASDVQVLSDEPRSNRRSTLANITTAFTWLVDGAVAGDDMYLHFSGLGAQLADAGRAADAILPTDHDGCARFITDAQLGATVFDRVPAGARLTVVLDCNLSGTLTADLAAQASLGQTPRPGGRRVTATAFTIAPGATSRHYPVTGSQIPSASATVTAANVLSGASASRHTKSGGSVLLFTACGPHQTAVDVPLGDRWSGALTLALNEILEQSNCQATYRDIAVQAGDLLHAIGIDQDPILSTMESSSVDLPFLGALPSGSSAQGTQQLNHISFTQDSQNDNVTAGAPAAPNLGLDVVDGKKGVAINAVTKGTPCAEAGLRNGDVILAINGHNIPDVRFYRAVVETLGGQPTADFLISRFVYPTTRTVTIKVQLAEESRSSSPILLDSDKHDELSRVCDALGFTLSPLGGGLTVTTLVAGGKAANAGVQLFDVILYIGTVLVPDPSRFVKAMLATTGRTKLTMSRRAKGGRIESVVAYVSLQ